MRPVGYKDNNRHNQFLLTHPMRGATMNTRSWGWIHNGFLLTHPMRGATAPPCSSATAAEFLLTHPMRGATAKYSIYSASHHNMERTLNSIILNRNIFMANYAFFEANLPFFLHHRRFARLLLRLNYYNSLGIICAFCTYVFYPSFPVVAKIIEPQTVLFFINY